MAYSGKGSQSGLASEDEKAQKKLEFTSPICSLRWWQRRAGLSPSSSGWQFRKKRQPLPTHHFVFSGQSSALLPLASKFQRGWIGLISCLIASSRFSFHETLQPTSMADIYQCKTKWETSTSENLRCHIKGGRNKTTSKISPATVLRGKKI